MDDMAGEGGRATVAVAVAEIRGVAALVAQHQEMTRADFGEVKQRLDKIEALPERMARLEESHVDHERRITDMEQRPARARAEVIAWMAVGVALLGLLLAQFH